jgi:hypothetical protein
MRAGCAGWKCRVGVICEHWDQDTRLTGANKYKLTMYPTDLVRIHENRDTGWVRTAPTGVMTL